jgi:hypothetical protein
VIANNLGCPSICATKWTRQQLDLSLKRAESPPDGHETFSEFGRMVVIKEAKLKVINNNGPPE